MLQSIYSLLRLDAHVAVTSMYMCAWQRDHERVHEHIMYQRMHAGVGHSMYKTDAHMLLLPLYANPVMDLIHPIHPCCCSSSSSTGLVVVALPVYLYDRLALRNRSAAAIRASSSLAKRLGSSGLAKHDDTSSTPTCSNMMNSNTRTHNMEPRRHTTEHQHEACNMTQRDVMRSIRSTCREAYHTRTSHEPSYAAV